MGKSQESCGNLKFVFNDKQKKSNTFLLSFSLKMGDNDTKTMNYFMANFLRLRPNY